MKKFLLLSLLTLTTAVFSCPGGLSISIDTPLTKITGLKSKQGMKLDGYLNVETNINGKKLKYRIELGDFGVGKVFSFPATEDKDIYFSIVDENEKPNMTDVIYTVQIEGSKEIDIIDPYMVPRGGCGYELKL